MTPWLALCLSWPVLQEPAPEPAPPPEPPGQGEQPQNLDPEVEKLFAEIQELIGKVRDGFQKVDTGLRETRGLLDRPDAPAQDFQGRLTQTVTDADDLLARMEELLAKLPESENQNPQSGGGGGQSHDQPRPNQAEPQGLEESPRDSEQENEYDRDPLRRLRRMMLYDQRYGAWGFLPPRLQEALNNASAEDLPLRYRRWLEQYHRNASRERR